MIWVCVVYLCVLLCVLGMLWVCFGYALCVCWVCVGYVLGMFCECDGYDLCMIWVCYGCVLGMCVYVCV